MPAVCWPPLQQKGSHNSVPLGTASCSEGDDYNGRSAGEVMQAGENSTA